MDRDSPVIFSYVTLEQGTGLVHTAPGHGAEDYELGQKYGLETLAPVDDGGVFTKEAGQFAGQFVFKANKSIVDHLQAIGALAAHAEVKHSYPHCCVARTRLFSARWNSGSCPWIIAACARARWMRRAGEVVPKWGENRFTSTTSNSGQLGHLAAARVGRAVAVLECRDCDKPLLDRTLNLKFARR